MRNWIAAFAAVLALAYPALGTVTGNPPPAVYTCTGNTVFTIPFPYLAASQVVATQTTAAGVVTTVIGTVKPSIAPTVGTITLPAACPSGSTLTISRSVPLTQPDSFRTGSYSGPNHERAFDRLAMQIQQINAKEIADLGIVNNTVAAFNASGAAIGSTTSVLATGSTTPRTLAARAADVANVKDFGARGDGTTDDTAAIQAALNTGNDVTCPVSATYKVSNSLYMQTAGQTFSGACTLTMDAGLAKPILWLGASDATGTASSPTPVNMKVRGVRFIGSGTKSLGSAGIAFRQATTTTLDSIESWNFYAGIDVRGLSLVNYIINPDLRQNMVGLNDRTDASGTIDFQGSRIMGGRIESNGNEGIVAGTADLMVTGATIEGNGSVAQGGGGTSPEIRLTQGFQGGTFTLVEAHIEVSSSATSVIQVDANACRFVDIIGGFIAAGGAATHYLVNTSSNCTVQGFGFHGGRYTAFKNWVKGAIVNNGAAVILPTWADASVDATVDLTATAGATIFQLDRVLGLKSNVPLIGAGITGSTVTTTAASGNTAVQLVTGSKVNLGGTSTITGDGTGQVTLSGNTFVGSGGNLSLHAGGVVNDSTGAGWFARATLPAATTGVATQFGNTNSMTSPSGRIGCFYKDNMVTTEMCVDINGGTVHTGVTFANLATGSTTNGTITYCSDCTIANPCASGGTGAIAKRLNSVWVCN